jgi:hypothetical protein
MPTCGSAAGELACVRASARACVRASARSICFLLPATSFACALAHRHVRPCPCARARAHACALVFSSSVWVRVSGAVCLSACAWAFSDMGLGPARWASAVRACAHVSKCRVCACMPVGVWGSAHERVVAGGEGVGKSACQQASNGQVRRKCCEMECNGSKDELNEAGVPAGLRVQSSGHIRAVANSLALRNVEAR